MDDIVRAVKSHHFRNLQCKVGKVGSLADRVKPLPEADNGTHQKREKRIMILLISTPARRQKY